MRLQRIAAALSVIVLATACSGGSSTSPVGMTATAAARPSPSSTASTQSAVAAEPDAENPSVTITSVEPAIGPTDGETVVTITGSGFVAGAEVGFGTKSGTEPSIDSPTTITVFSPAGTAGPVEVSVTLPDGALAVASDAFTYVAKAAAPDITSARVIDRVVVLAVAKPHVSEAVEYYQVSVDGGEWRSLDASEWRPAKGEAGIIVTLRDPVLEPGQTTLIQLRAVSVAGFGAESRALSIGFPASPSPAQVT